MGRNEIKLRRQMTGLAQQYRNYSALMQRYHRSRRLSRYLRFFIYSLIVTVVVVLFLIVMSYVVIRLERKQEQRQKNQGTSQVPKQASRHR